MSGPVPTDQIRTLPTRQLALRLLTKLASGSGHNINANNLLRGAQQAFDSNQEKDSDFLLGRLADAWAWLESRGLIGPESKSTTSSWQRVTTEGHELAKDEAALTKLWAAERLAGRLDPALERARAVFDLGDYETACFAAMKAVEVEVRRAAGMTSDVLGIDLMRQAFRPGAGPLADAAAHKGEQVALMELFAGAMGAFKNPSSHRTVHFDDPVEATEVVQLANLLLRLLRRAESRTASSD
jgi:uncharacterized protein (TIGR02391 family)